MALGKTILFTDDGEELVLTNDGKNGRPKRYGVGGESKLCYEQTVLDLIRGSEVLYGLAAMLFQVIGMTSYLFSE